MANNVSILSTDEAERPGTEHALILHCARTQLRDDDRDRIAELLAGPVDWPSAIAIATKHGVLKLLERHIAGPFADRVPEEVATELKQRATRIAAYNLFQTGELLRIVAAFEAEGLAIVPFKGPSLAMQAYGDVAMRGFYDLDILIRRDQFARVKERLAGLGFRPYRSFDAEQEVAFLDTQMGYEFMREDRRVVVESHWTFLNRVHAFRPDMDAVWGRMRTLDIYGRSIPRLSTEDLLLYLCAHGVRSFWNRLIWICDVAELIAHADDLDWDALLTLADRTESRRILCVGLYLAHSFLGTALPADLEPLVLQDRRVARLAARAYERYTCRHDAPLTSAEKIRDHLAMRERFVDKFSYMVHIARLTLFS